MEKIVEIAVLFDYYGKLLSKKQYNVVDQYCNEDLSLNEIAELNGITKQGISDILGRAEKKMKKFENELKLIEKNNYISDSLRNINNIIDQLDSKNEENLLQILLSIREINKELIENLL